MSDEKMKRTIEYVAPMEIEKRSFEIIAAELKEQGITLPEDKAFIIMRAIHTSADFEYANTLRFSENAIEKMAALLREGATIITDTNMGLSGVNKTELEKYGCKACCFMADPQIASEAKERGLTRAAVSMEHAASLPGKKIFVVGNAPTALITLREMYDEGIFTADFVIGVPVGFVNVEVSKEMIMETEIPYIVNQGRKGGSNIAAALCNAVLYEMRKGRI